MISNAQARVETLTPRERDVLALVTAGLMNKQIAAELGIAEITVKIHRGHVMKKMGTRSLADLVRITETLGIRRA
jgi:FixJ family two-component response regulator